MKAVKLSDIIITITASYRRWRAAEAATRCPWQRWQVCCLIIEYALAYFTIYQDQQMSVLSIDIITRTTYSQVST